MANGPHGGHHTAQAHHHPGHAHPPAAVSASLLRLSVAQRLGLAAVLIALVWLTVFWTI
jgi:hypothetical protein